MLSFACVCWVCACWARASWVCACLVRGCLVRGCWHVHVEIKFQAQEDILKTSYNGRLNTRVVGYSGDEVVQTMLDPSMLAECDVFVRMLLLWNLILLWFSLFLFPLMT